MSRVEKIHVMVSTLATIVALEAMFIGQLTDGIGLALHWTLLISLMACATYTDCLGYRIPNALTYTTAICLLTFLTVYEFFPGCTWHPSIAPSESISALLICGSIALLGRSVHAIGGGDVKIVAVIGLFLGLATTLHVFLLAHLVAAVHILFSGGFSRLQRIIGSTEALPVDSPSPPRPGRIPMAGFYTAGILIVTLEPFVRNL